MRIGGASYADRTLNELAQLTGKREEKNNWNALLQPGVRNVLMIGIVLAIFQQWCGINVIFNYAHEIFSEAGLYRFRCLDEYCRDRGDECDLYFCRYLYGG